MKALIDHRPTKSDTISTERDAMFLCLCSSLQSFDPFNGKCEALRPCIYTRWTPPKEAAATAEDGELLTLPSISAARGSATAMLSKDGHPDISGKVSGATTTQSKLVNVDQ